MRHYRHMTPAEIRLAADRAEAGGRRVELSEAEVRRAANRAERTARERPAERETSIGYHAGYGAFTGPLPR